MFDDTSFAPVAIRLCGVELLLRLRVLAGGDSVDPKLAFAVFGKTFC